MPATAGQARNDWQTLELLFPYLWNYRARVLIALACLVAAKLATSIVPRSVLDTRIFTGICRSFGASHTKASVLPSRLRHPSRAA